MANFQVTLFTLLDLNDSLVLEKGFLLPQTRDISAAPQGSKADLHNLDHSSVGVVMPC